MLGTGVDNDVEEIAKFSQRDAENYPKYEAMLERVASVVEPTLTQMPPNLVRPSLGQLLEAGKMGRALQQLGPAMGEAIEVLTGAARPILDRWFESEELKGTIATDAIIGAFMAPSMPGTAYVLFHHVMGETNGKRGVWSYVRGGMGGLTQALAAAATALGVEIRTDAEVAKILTRGGRVTGVALTNGDEFPAQARRQRRRLPRDVREAARSGRACRRSFDAAVARISYSSASCKINVALERLPSFTRAAGTRARAAALRHGAPLPGSGLHRTRLRRREVRRLLARAGRRVHDAVVARSDRRAAGQAPDVDVHAVRAVSARTMARGPTRCATNTPIAASTSSNGTRRASRTR